MKANFRKLLSMLLALTMGFGMIPAVSAEGEVVEVSTSAALITALENGGTVKLTGDIALDALAEVPANVTAVLDLNGKTVSSDNGRSKYLHNKGTLTIQDSVGGGKITASGNSSSGVNNRTTCIMNDGNLTIAGGEIVSKSESYTNYAIFNQSGNLTITGGTIKAQQNTAANAVYALGLGGNGNVKISNATLEATGGSKSNSAVAAIIYMITNATPQITIESGTFNAALNEASTVGASLIREKGTGNAGASITISGGTFDLGNGTKGVIEDMSGTVTITGGTFTGNVGDYLNPEEYEQDPVTGTVGLKGNGGGEEPDEPDDDGINTTEELQDAVNKGGNVELAASFDLTAKVTIPSGVTVTLDLNGQTITSDDSTAYYIYNQGNLTVKDSGEGGKIHMTATTDDGDRANCINNEGDLTIEGGELISTTSGDCAKTNYTIFSTSGNVTITGGTIKAENTYKSSVYALGLGGNSTVDISNATFSVDNQYNSTNYCAAIIYLTKNSDSQVTINSGSFEATMNNGVGASIIRAGSGADDARLTVKGGTFDIGVGTNGLCMGTSSGVVSITGGTFPADVSKYLPDGYEQLADGSVVEGANANTYVAQLISYFEKHQDAAATDIQRVLAELKELDADTAEVWEKIMIYWREVNAEGFVNVGTVPQGLPNDNSLAIVILGYQLNDDGTMKAELVGRLQTGLAIANAYPNAYVCVTGGGTAANNPDVTEGGLMGQWLLDSGLSKDRLIIEDKAGSTVANAKNTYDVLVANYQSVDNIVMVTSDYHISRGSLLYYTKFVLEAQATGGKEIGILANCGFDTDKNYETIATQATSLRTLVGSTKVEVILSVLDSLTVTQEAPYVTGNDLELTVKANYDSGYSKVVEATITGFDKTKGPEQIITIKYTENGVTREGMFRLSETSVQIVSGPATEVATSADFVAAMAAGGNIRLTGSFTLAAKATIPVGKTVVLDLNGKTITSNDGSANYIHNQGTLTIMDSSADVGGITVDQTSTSNTGNVYCVNNDAALTVEKGNLTASSKGGTAYAIYSKGSSVTLNGGNFAANYTNKSGVYQAQTLGFGGTNAIVSITGGNFAAKSDATSDSTRCATLYTMSSGKNVQITIDGGTFTSTRTVGTNGASFLRAAGANATVTINGGTFSATNAGSDYMFNSMDGTLNIDGGTFQYDGQVFAKKTATITGGTFLTTGNGILDVSDYVANTHAQLDDGSVKAKETVADVTMVGSTAYKSLWEAVSKSNPGDMITLQADAAPMEVVAIPVGVTIDLNGKTLNASGMIGDVGQIVDSTQTGLLKIAKDRAIFNGYNEYLPIWDENAGGYRMAQVKIQIKTTSTVGVYYFRYDLINAAWEELLPGSDVTMLLRVEGYATPFQVPADMLARLYADETGRGAIKVTFIGMDNQLNVRVGVASREVELGKFSGAEPTPVMTLAGPTGNVDTLASDVRTYLANATAKYDNATEAELETMTTAKSSDTQSLYTSMQAVEFNWALENAEFVQGGTKFYIQLSQDADFASYESIRCTRFAAGKQEQCEPVWNLMTGTTYYWRVVTNLADGTQVSSDVQSFTTAAGPRQINVDGVSNARDLGGWTRAYDITLYDGTVLKAGTTVAQGYTYRSAKLEYATDAGKNTLVNELGINFEIDLRSGTSSTLNEKAMPVLENNFYRNSSAKQYADYITDPATAGLYLKNFTKAENYPIIFHCNGGADRTGSLAFILGALQGVSEADLIKDYEFTSKRLVNGYTDGSFRDFPGFLKAFHALDGDTPYEKARNFCLSAGLTDAQIDNIILLMCGMEPKQAQ